MQSQTLQINKDLHESGKEVLLRNDDLIQTRIRQKNLNSAVESLTACLPVLRMYGKVCEQMKEERLDYFDFVLTFTMNSSKNTS